jgi:hypothetical protein
MHDISYRTFYDKFYEVIKKDSLGGSLLSNVEEILINYLEHGKVPDNKKWGNVVALTLSESYGGNFIYDNRDYFIGLGIDTGKEFCELDKGIIDLQRAFIKNDNLQYPYIVKSNIDIDRWEYHQCDYQINCRVSVSHQQDQMYEKWLRKTDIHNLTTPYVEKFIDDTYKGEKIIIPIIQTPTTVMDGRLL